MSTVIIAPLECLFTPCIHQSLLLIIVVTATLAYGKTFPDAINFLYCLALSEFQSFDRPSFSKLPIL